MNIVKDINRVRRTFFTGATKHIANDKTANLSDNAVNVRKILVCRPNQRLGNLLLITPLIQELESTFPEAKIDLIVKGGLANIVFKNFTGIHKIYQLPNKPFLEPITYLKNYYQAMAVDYDLVINATDGSSSGKIITQNSKSKYKLFGKPGLMHWVKIADYKHIAKKPILALRERSGKGRHLKIPTLDLKLSEDELMRGRNLLNQVTMNAKKTICIFTYATGNKMYCKKWWNQLYLEMLLNFKDFNIVEILPKENVSQIDFKAPTFYGRNIRELGAVIAASEVFLGADSGIMHLASSVDVPTLGLFNVTDIDMYRPYNNLSQAINTNQVDVLQIISQLKSTLESKKAQSISLK
ncbi:MAG: ADP-heptose--LPS heptosyltransferase [marine bacterium B5-7]|nr:MAG: ADP-heptose--LPS heptosyltransferase [marine bacterium B5-7]